MFSGIQEILLIVLILLGIFLVPRMMKPQQAPRRMAERPPVPPFSWTLRLAIVLSLLWPVFWALYLKPWQQDITAFAFVGIGPVAIGWGFKWILAGMRNRR